MLPPRALSPQRFFAISRPAHPRRGHNGALRLLVVESETGLRMLFGRGLREEGYAVDLAEGGRDALWMARAVDYHAILLDQELPGVDALEVCRRLRSGGVWTPVLMLAGEGVAERVSGLDAGADDCLSRPFAFDELLARLRALTRRHLPGRPALLEVGELRLDPAAHRVWRGEHELALSMREFRLLELLMRSPGVALTRTQLHDGAWDHSCERRSNVIDVTIRGLREKIDRPFGRQSIETVRGMGYRLRRS